MIKTNKGFTVTELVIVACIITVVVALVFPRYMTVVERQRAQEGVQILNTLLSAQLRYHIDHGSYTSNLDNLDVEIPNSSYFSNIRVLAGGGLAAIAATDRSISGVTAYTLGILEDSTIACAWNAGGTLDSNICSKIGY